MNNGWLALIWSFPMLADAHIQRQLNEVAFTGVLADLRRDPDQHMTDIGAALADGRRELVVEFTTVGLAIPLSEWQVRRPERHSGDAVFGADRARYWTAFGALVCRLIRCAIALSRVASRAT